MRDRLIELIVSADISLFGTDKPYAEVYADHLLANGVIVPPCKVGGTVYMPWEWNSLKGIAFFEVTHIIIDGLHAYIKTNFYTDDEDYYNAYGCGRFEFDDFGKTVFLTREEAEKALKKRSDTE